MRQGLHGWVAGAMLAAAAGIAAERPNLLLIIADDCTYRDMAVYGGQARTPSLQKLAGEGMRFDRCFQAAPMCSPTRHCLYTGLYPVKSGAYPNHTMAYDWVRSIAHHLQAAGYRTHLSGKTHIHPPAVFPFEYSKTPNGGDPDPAALEKAIAASRESGTPFLFIAASHEPHSPWNKGDPSAYPPASLQLPPVWVDSPETRHDYSRYLAEITFFDAQVGDLVGRIDRHGLRDRTLVLVLGEQGNSFPFAKWTCYEAGLQSACVARWPGRVNPGSVSTALVEYVDVVPTFLDAAGIAAPAALDGRSFLPVLDGRAAAHKTHVFGLQTTRGIINGSEHYGIRSVRDARHRYILNLTPDAVFQNAATRDPVFQSWQRIADAGDAAAARLVNAYQRRPAEELYDCAADPWNLTNLVGRADVAAVRDGLRARLDEWMKQQGDEGQATEMKALDRMPRPVRAKEGAANRRAGAARNRRTKAETP